MRPSPRAFVRPAQVLTLSVFVGAAALLGLSCASKGGEGSTGTAASATATATATSSATDDDDAPKGKKKDDALRPLYPVDNSPPDPLAQRFCGAIHDLEPKRRGECCGAPGTAGHFTGECTRVLSAAIRLNAVKLDSAAVDKCEQAVTKDLEGCGWVGVAPPPLPAECESVITGLLADKAVCRSSLECADGLACQGLSATQVGKCLPPKPAGLVCGGTVDTLAAMTFQNRSSERHPECAGVCARPVCADAPKTGAACKSNAECGRNRTCAGDKCSDKPLPGDGQPCAAGECERGARCVKNKCIAPKAEGQACESDVECRGACDKPEGAAAGKCGKRCTVLNVTAPPASMKKAPQPPPRR